MQPPVEADLRAIRQSLERMAADEDLGGPAVAVLAEVGRSLRRLERTWSRVLPYLVAENAATAALLHELAPVLPAPMRDEAASAGPVPEPAAEPRAMDATYVNELNGELRGLLARAIAGLPADEEGTRARAQVREHLQSTVKLRPW